MNKYFERLSAILLAILLLCCCEKTPVTEQEDTSDTPDYASMLPAKPKAGEDLHILLFGHSFGADCYAYLPSITKAAGISNVHYARWYQGNCSLAEHWGHILDKDSYDYWESYSGSTVKRKVDDVLKECPWDIIIFQQSIGFSGAGKYLTYQPYLNNLVKYVTEVCQEKHGKTPVIGWNMFWSFNSGKETDRDIDASSMFGAIQIATKEMMADTDIKLVIPSGAAVQNARQTSLNTSKSQLFTRDGYHASYGIGRYVTACTWFETLIAPIYKVSVKGNSYRPSNYSFDGDQITEQTAAILQKCAITAVKHPFKIINVEKD